MSAVLDRLINSDFTSRADEPQGPERTLLSWLNRLDREAQQWRDDKDHNTWEQFVRAYGGPRAATNAPKFSANVIRPVLDRRNALLTENKPNAKILPWREGLQQASEILEKLFDADWHATEMQLNIEEMVQLATVIGSAGIDAAWNKAARYGEGAFDPVVLDPRQVGFDPYVRKARNLDKAQYLWIETIKNIWELQREYPGRGMLIKPDRQVSSINSMINPGNSSVIGNLSTDWKSRQKKLEEGPWPRKICREYWIRDPTLVAKGGMKWPDGRKIERAGSLILDDNPNPYFDGEWPVIWYDGKADIDTPWGRSEVEALRYIANAINRIGNLFVENSILGGNLVIITDADAITNETRNKLTNAAGLIIPKKFGRQLEYRAPPPMPPHMLQFVTWALGLIDYLVGLRDGQMEGKGRVELRSGVQLEGLQQAAQVLIRASARRLESFMERFGQKWISRVFQFYTGSRLLWHLGDQNDWQKWEFNYGKLQDAFVGYLKANGKEADKSEALHDAMRTAWRQFSFKIAPFSSLAANKIARGQMLMQLAETGRFPMSRVMAELGFDAPKELMGEAKAEAMEFGPPNPTKPQKGKK